MKHYFRTLTTALLFIFSANANEESQFPTEVKKAMTKIDLNELVMSSPVPGKVEADYSSVYVKSEDKTYYEAFFWNTTNGQSRLYYYNYTDKAFKLYEENVQLPNNPLEFVPEGKVMANYTAIYIPTEDKTYYEVLYWDTHTGRSRLYYYNFTDKVFKAYEENVQLPSNPLGFVAEGDVMADYTSIFVPSEDKTYYEVFFWDTKSGRSRLYYYDYTDKVFKAYAEDVQLPSNPLGSVASGNIMADYASVHIPTQDKTYYEVLFWDDKTGTSKLYYYNFIDKAFVEYDSNVQLPEEPLDFQPQGRVMANYSSIFVDSEDKTYYEAIFWDTKSGKSMLYYFNYTDNAFVAYDANVQLPSFPLDFAPTGSVNADYESVYVPSEDKTYYEILFWDNASGRSTLYYYNYTDKVFKKYDESVQLTDTPL